jgi:hypothetical protein
MLLGFPGRLSVPVGRSADDRPVAPVLSNQFMLGAVGPLESGQPDARHAEDAQRQHHHPNDPSGPRDRHAVRHDGTIDAGGARRNSRKRPNSQTIYPDQHPRWAMKVAAEAVGVSVSAVGKVRCPKP